jgi:hypothetical protein
MNRIFISSSLKDAFLENFGSVENDKFPIKGGQFGPSEFQFFTDYKEVEKYSENFFKLNKRLPKIIICYTDRDLKNLIDEYLKNFSYNRTYK